MGRKFKQPGDVLTHKPAAAQVVNDVIVIGDSTVAVTLVDIAANAEGSVGVEGVFEAPKLTGTAWVQGDTLDWNETDGVFLKSAAPGVSKLHIRNVAFAAAAALAADAVGLIKLANPGTRAQG